MTARTVPSGPEFASATASRVGFYAEIFNPIITLVTFGFAILAAVILLVDYFIQFSVVPVSLMSGETEGIPLLTLYNPHGIFI